MEMTKDPLKNTGNDGSPDVEKAEVKIADAMGRLADLLRGLHKQGPNGEPMDAEGDEKDAKIAEIASMFSKLGASEDDVSQLKGALNDLVQKPEDANAAHDEDDTDVDDLDGDDDKDDVGSTNPGDDEGNKDDNDDFEDVVRDAIKACGYDEESPEFQQAFAEGVRYGEKKGNDEPKQIEDDQDEDEKQKALAAQDAAIKRFELKLDAIDECKTVLGKVRASSFDSAGSVYLAALKQLGVPIKNVKPEQAQAVYYGFMAGRKNAKKAAPAQDAKPKEDNDLMKGIKVRI